MAARRAKRAPARQTAKNLARAESQSAKEFRALANDAIAGGLQEFAVLSMNNLAKAGPAWSGEFSASWGFAPEGRTPNTPGTTGKVHRYTKNDITLREMKRYLNDGVTRFAIVNTAPHAAIAIDAEAAKFAPPASQPFPIGDNVQYGTSRPSGEHLRWQIRNESGEDITSQITAEQDWFEKYVKGGGLQGDLSRGFSIGFGAAS
jgi:hypothetical protein